MKTLIAILIFTLLLAACTDTQGSHDPKGPPGSAVEQVTLTLNPTWSPIPTPTWTPTPTATPCDVDDSTSEERRALYDLSLNRNPSWSSAPDHVRDFLISKFDPLEAQYLTLRTLSPGQMGTWKDYLISNPTMLSGEGWSHLFSTITDLAFSEENPSTCAYKLLEDHGVNILAQAVSANLSPGLGNSVRDVIYTRWRQYVWDGSYSQAEFVRREIPGLAEILDNE